MAPLVTTLIPILGNLFDRVFPDPKAAADAKLEVMRMAQAGELAQLNADLQLATGQIEVNKAEATSGSMFVAGARPFILWICGISLGYVALIEPIARFVATVVYGYRGSFPAIDTSLTMQLLFGLLGLAGYRTFEKVKGVAS
jgi:hypothetical protein